MKTFYLVMIILNQGQPTGISTLPMLDEDTCQFALHQMQGEIPLDKISLQCVFSGKKP